MRNENRNKLDLDSVAFELNRLDSGDTSVELEVDARDPEYEGPRWVSLSLKDQKKILDFLQSNIDRWDTEEGVAALKRAEETHQERKARLAAEAAKPKLLEYEIEYLVDGQENITHTAKIKAFSLAGAFDVLKGTRGEAMTLIGVSLEDVSVAHRGIGVIR